MDFLIDFCVCNYWCSCNLLSKWIRSYTHFGSTGIYLDTSGDSNVPKGQVPIWSKIWIFILDEVSMLSATMIDRLDRRIQLLTGNKDLWYGNLDILFAGDFFQLPPRGGFGLYSNLIIVLSNDILNPHNCVL